MMRFEFSGNLPDPVNPEGMCFPLPADIIVHMTEQEQFISEEILPENGKWSELRKYRKDLSVAGEAILWFGICAVALIYDAIMQVIAVFTPTRIITIP